MKQELRELLDRWEKEIEQYRKDNPDVTILPSNLNAQLDCATQLRAVLDTWTI